LVKEERKEAKRRDDQDQPQDDQEPEDVGSFWLAVEKWHRGYFTRTQRQVAAVGRKLLDGFLVDELERAREI
jgi:hypothetical protein